MGWATSPSSERRNDNSNTYAKLLDGSSKKTCLAVETALKEHLDLYTLYASFFCVKGEMLSYKRIEKLSNGTFITNAHGCLTFFLDRIR